MNTARAQLQAIFEAGLAAADPFEAVRRHVACSGERLRVGERTYDLTRGRVWVVGAGKASARMGQALEAVLGARIAGGWINVKTGHGLPLRQVHVHEAAHPVPDASGVAGTQEILHLLRRARAEDVVLLCLSGGGSALLPMPVAGVTLADKQRTTQALLACGAEIGEINCVRKHLSRVKGGQLARAAQPAAVAALILSDVIGDPLDTIASGPTAPDPTTFAQALAVLGKYGIEGAAPADALAHLRAGAEGRVPETPKPGDPLFAKVQNLIVANNTAAVEACAAKARELGCRPMVLSTRMEGEAREVARAHAAIAREVREHGRPVAPPACLISGGETTVTLRGRGRGGRNQEFALAAAIALRGVPGIAVLAAGTDGTDGPTDAAGAFADGETVDRAAGQGLRALDALAANDSYRFFDPLGDLLKTGPTGTNVMDLYLVRVEGRA